MCLKLVGPCCNAVVKIVVPNHICNTLACVVDYVSMEISHSVFSNVLCNFLQGYEGLIPMHRLYRSGGGYDDSVKAYNHIKEYRPDVKDQSEYK